MTATARRKNTHKRRRKRNSSGSTFWAFLKRHRYFKTACAGAVILLVAYIYLAYTYLINPYTLRWKGFFGDIETPKGYSIHGIDVSHHQGEIDWDKVSDADIAGNPVSFVMIKATEGSSHLDDNFNENFYYARQNGIIRGAYHFYNPAIPAEKQARYYLKQVHLEPGDLPPILDIETKGELSLPDLQKEIMKWLDIVEKQYKIKPIIYTNYKFKTDYLNTAKLSKYPFWIAHYYVKNLAYKGPWKFWQHTDNGKVNGIKGQVDLDIYNGSMYELKHLTIPDN